MRPTFSLVAKEPIEEPVGIQIKKRGWQMDRAYTICEKIKMQLRGRHRSGIRRRGTEKERRT